MRGRRGFLTCLPERGTMKAHGRIYRLSGVFWYEGKKVVGKCPELGVSSFGRNIEEAKKR